MRDLIAKSPLAGRAAVTVGATTLGEVALGPITSVAPFRGREADLAQALMPLGLAFPPPNRFSASEDRRLVWTGRDQAFLIGDWPDGLGTVAALTDQSDGWAALRLAGPAAEAVLARLLPIDLRLSGFAVGHAARAPLNHMSCIVMRIAPQGFDLLVFRSMARTAWHELDAALTGVQARSALT